MTCCISCVETFNYLCVICIHMSPYFLIISPDSTAVYIVNKMGPKTDHCGTPQVKPVGLEITLPALTVCLIPLNYEANHVRGTPHRPTLSDSRLSRVSKMLCSAPSMKRGDYQWLLADRCESSAMPSLCCDLFYRLIVLSHTDCVNAYDGIVLQQRSFFISLDIKDSEERGR